VLSSSLPSWLSLPLRKEERVAKVVREVHLGEVPHLEEAEPRVLEEARLLSRPQSSASTSVLPSRLESILLP
jgi:hypothetical protein